MGRSETGQNATNILPIPPALDFPFPQANKGPSGESLQPSIPLEASRTAEDSNAADLEHLPKTGAKPYHALKPPRPRPLKATLSERPVPAQRGSMLRMRRGQTTFAPTALTDAIGAQSTDSDTSDDEHPRLASPPSQLSGHSSSNRFVRSDPNKNSKRRRESEGEYGKFSVGNERYKTKGNVSKRDGRLNISVNETNNRGYLAHALGATLKNHLKQPSDGSTGDTNVGLKDKPRRPDLNERLTARSPQTSLEGVKPVPPLNIVIMVIGSRGDIQPFLKVGKLLKEDYGHRVRIATHPAFKEFVEQDTGLEFFSVGGDPAELMAFMVKNPGLMPSVSTVRAGEVGRRRDSMFEMFQGFWRACINATDDEKDISNLKMMGDKHPFVADAIIANPPSFAHVHCAERLGVPLHLMFTFPYSPTQHFPHPLANIKNSNVDTNYTNFMSYPLVEMMTWQGLGDLVNRFRVKTLRLEPVSTLWAPGQLYRQKVPYTYMWSPGLIPKPDDWGPEIDIAGFVFLDLASSFKPPDPLAEFLDAGEPPVYIGFGSIVVDDPDVFTSLIFEAVQKAGIRALVSKGWGGLGDEGNTPDNIYMLENTPHDWLFPRVSAVVHHGGAGTTAIGLKCGKPTMIVPFFGDQPFWGAMVAKAGAGAHGPVPYKRLTADALAEGILQCLTSEAKEAAEKLAKDIANEGDGAKNATESFQRHLPIKGEHSMCCSILPDQPAVWTMKSSNLRLSALAAELLIREKKIKWQELRLLRHYDWNDFEGPGEPLTGGGMAIVNSLGGVVTGVGSLPVKWAKIIKEKSRKRKSTSQAEINGQIGKHPNAHDMVQNGNAKTIERPSSSDQNFFGEPLTWTHSKAAQDRMRDIEQEPAPNGAPLNGVEGDHLAPALKSKSSPDNLARELAETTGNGFAKTGEALARVPMDLSLAVAQGFHNAPRLYGDSTVRTAPHITGIQSGLRAAGAEFTLGIYDGVTGLVIQPYNGAREGGALGFVKGIGKGVGGFVLKDLSALISPFGYTMKGLHKQLIKGREPTTWIRRARILDGLQRIHALDEKTQRRKAEKVNAAWGIICEIRREDEAHRREGVKGRVAVAKEQKMLEKNGPFEDVGEARKVLKTKREERKGRQSLAEARGNGDGDGGVGKDRRGSRVLGKKVNLLKPAKRELGQVNGKVNESREAQKIEGSADIDHAADEQRRRGELRLEKVKSLAIGAEGEGIAEDAIDHRSASVAA